MGREEKGEGKKVSGKERKWEEQEEEEEEVEVEVEKEEDEVAHH